MFWASDSVGVTFDFHKNTAEIKPTPDFPVLCRMVITGAAPPAEWALILMPCIGTSLDAKVGNTVGICVKIVRFYNSMLDVEQFFA